MGCCSMDGHKDKRHVQLGYDVPVADVELVDFGSRFVLVLRLLAAVYCGHHCLAYHRI